MQPLKLVSIGVPIYKRLEYLPSILKMVYAQDYPSIELIISDNGQNGTKVREIIEAQLSSSIQISSKLVYGGRDEHLQPDNS